MTGASGALRESRSPSSASGSGRCIAGAPMVPDLADSSLRRILTGEVAALPRDQRSARRGRLLYLQQHRP